MTLSEPYDRMGRLYEKHVLDGAYNAHYDRPAMMDAIGPVDGLDVLDAACGPGVDSAELAARGAHVRAFDGSAEMVKLASDRAADSWEVLQASFDEPLPYAGASFDVVVCALAIHYAADRAATFAEFHRVLRPGGRYFVSTQHPTSDWLRKGGLYFDVRLETDVWGEWSGGQSVQYWREPLGVFSDAATSSGFLIRRVIEPLPAESMREVDPEDYEKLMAAPAFIILDLLKL